jgi:hypothetical protein
MNSECAFSGAAARYHGWNVTRLQNRPLGITISRRMDEAGETRKHEADKIALLGLFAVGLLVARFITGSRYTGPRKAGEGVVASVKQKGIANFLDERGWQSFFLVKDARGRTVGFSIDAFTKAEDERALRIQGTGLSYIRGRYRQEHVASFQSDESFEEFLWRSESTGLGGRRGAEIILGEDGRLTVTRNNGNMVKESYKPAPALVPDFLLDLVLGEMLEGGQVKIIIDTISAEGRVVEVVISRSSDGGSSASEGAYRLNVDFLGEPRYSQIVYFDGEGQISKKLMEKGGTYLFERAGVEDMLRYFPDWADYFLQKQPDREQL